MFTFKKEAAEAVGACRRCDAKWLSAILAAVLIAAALVAQAGARLVDEKPGVDAIAAVFALIVSPKGIDDPADVDGLRQMLATKGGAEVKPFPGMDIRVKESDIEGMSPREVRFFLFRQVGEPLWQSGEDGLARVFEDETVRAQIKGQGIGMFRYVTRATHDRLDGWATTLLFLSVLFLLAAAMSSRGFGRFVTPALALLVGAVPVSVGGMWLRERIANLAAMTLSPGENPFAYIAHALGIALMPYVKTLDGPANVAVGGAVILLVAAFLGNGAVFVFVSVRTLVQRLRKAKK